jgi:predicted AlkP superfamily pyrophosphatase or phosphodiesterase
MKTVLIRAAMVVLSFFVVSSVCFTQAAERHVLVISIDGLPSYLLEDPKASLPTLRRLMQAGTFAKNGMKVSNPSVTWPNHTTLMTGVHADVHGVLFNGSLVRDGLGLPIRIESKQTQSDLVRVPLLFDVLKQAGFSTAAINWPCTRESESIDDNFPDVPDALVHSTPRLIKELASRGVLDEPNFMKISTIARDEVWTEAACLVIRERKPRFLALHLLNVDAVHHSYGPQTMAGYTAAAAADSMVARVLKAVEEAGLREQTTVMIVADHGFTHIPKSILPNVVLRKAGLLTVENSRIASARVHVFPEGGIGMLYLTVPESAEKDRKQAIELLRHVEGIETILEPVQFAEHLMPRPDEHPGMADLVLVAKDGYSFDGRATGDEEVITHKSVLGTHGFLSKSAKMNAAFIAAGNGIRPGAELGEIQNIDVAPTIARLFEQKLEHARGRVLTEILAP